jgi:L-fuculose-phosphate aldolase
MFVRAIVAGVRVTPEQSLPYRVALGAHVLAAEGCDSNVGGQLSARADDGSGFWCVAFEYFDQARPENVALVDWDLNVRAGHVLLAPALRTHAAIYARRADVNAVVHLHSHYVTALSTTGAAMGMYGVSAVLFDGEQVCYADDGHKPHSSVADELGDGRVAWMKNHGALIAAQSLEQAVVEAVTLEACARLHIDGVAIGGTELTRPEIDDGRQRYRPHYLHHMWGANSARVRARRPDLFPPTAD